MSGGDLVKQGIVDKKWSLLDGPYGTGFDAFPGLPTATPWSIMDRTDSEANAKDHSNANKLKIMCFGRDTAAQLMFSELWGYHDDGPPDHLCTIRWTLGSVAVGVDATLLPADVDKFSPHLKSAIGDGNNWFGADVAAVTVEGVYGSGVLNINSPSVVTNMNLANVILDLKQTGHTYLGIHMGASTMTAAFLMAVPVE